MQPNYNFKPEELYVQQDEIRARTGKLSPNILRDLSVAGLKPVKVFGVWMFYRAEFEQWLEKANAAYAEAQRVKAINERVHAEAAARAAAQSVSP